MVTTERKESANVEDSSNISMKDESVPKIDDQKKSNNQKMDDHKKSANQKKNNGKKNGKPQGKREILAVQNNWVPAMLAPKMNDKE